MKMLVCTDGSEQSQRVLEEALRIAEGCKPEDVAIIHVYRPQTSAFLGMSTNLTKEDITRLKKLGEEHKEEANKILEDASRLFKQKNINARTILEEGHPAETILQVASEESFDMIVIGSRGIGGWGKTILGSVSNQVVQEARNCSVVTVK